VKLVKVIDNEEVAKLLADPIRRAILNLLRREVMTESQLAAKLGLTVPTMNYHLRLLRRYRLVSVAKTEVEEHGIVQKFYVSNAYFYVPDVEKLPLDAARYYYPLNLERARAALGAMKVVTEGRVRLKDKDLDSLSEEFAKALVKVARQYEDEEIEVGGGEEQVNSIYSEAITRLLETSKEASALLAPLLKKRSNRRS